MRTPLIVAAALLTAGIWAAARSRPAAETGAEAARDLRLAEPAVAEAPVVSALESPHVPAAAAPRQPARIRRAASVEAPTGLTAALAEPTLALSVTATTAPAEFQAMTPIPAAVAPAAAEAPAVEVHAAASGPEPRWVGREPAIIIRGGMGSGHDDCKIVPGRRGGVAAAVNRLAPPIGGGYGRSGGSTGFRGGIR